MAVLLALARSKGWREALETYVRPRRPAVVQLVTDARRQRSIEPLQGIRNGRVLDFGCGFGGVSLQLAKIFDEVISLDGSANRLGFLNIVRRQENIENIVPVCHVDPLNLPFPDNHFDGLVLIGVLEYLPQSFPSDNPTEVHRKCLKEFYRVLRPGGHMLIHTKNRFGWPYWLGGRDHSGMRFAPILPRQLSDLILRIWKGRPYRIINYSLTGYRKLLSQTGMIAIRFGWPVPSYQMPDYMLSLDQDLFLELSKIEPAYHSSLKTMALRVLCLMKVLKYIVPNYYITAVKPG